MALRIQVGLAANMRPSSTKRIPRPMRKSANAMDLIGLEPPLADLVFRAAGGAAHHPALGIRLLLRRGWRCFRWLAAGIGKEPEEIRIRPQQEARRIRTQSIFVSRHRTIERKEIGILAVGLGEQAVALGI